MANIRIAKAMIKDCVIKSIKAQSKEAFQRSKPRTPVDTGKLKNTAQESELPNGSKLLWPADYASFVERGLTARYVNVRGYYHPNGYYVKSHRRWQPKRQPKLFIKTSMNEAFEGLADSLDSELRKTFMNVIRR